MVGGHGQMTRAWRRPAFLGLLGRIAGNPWIWCLRSPAGSSWMAHSEHAPGNLSRKPLYFNSRGPRGHAREDHMVSVPPNYFPNYLLCCVILQETLAQSVCLKRFRVVVCSLPN